MKYFIIPALAALFAASPAQATDFLTQTISIPSTAAPSTATLSFNQFDSSLGTLTSITLSFASTLIGNGTVTNTSGATHTYTLNEAASAALSGHGFSFTQTLASGTASTGPVAAHATVNLAPISGSGSDSSTITSGFADFLGLGTVSFDFSSTKSFSLTPASATLSLLASIGGAATISYGYDAATPPPVGGVPEPASWAMMLLGFGAMGAMMRRRSTSISFA